MGCDIHLMVELREKVKNPDSTRLDRWRDAGFRDEFLSRIYGMFARMAGVRDYGDDYKVKFEPRGFPEDMAWQTAMRFCLNVTDNENAVDCGGGHCSRKDAERWVEKGYTKWFDEGHTIIIEPDYHSCSWLTASELRECFDDCFKNEDGTYHGDYIEWLGLVSLCEGLESDGKHECRVVFCFDN